MGKPFTRELGFLKETLSWVDCLDVSGLRAFFETEKHLPLLAIGSGGSFSACHYAALLYECSNTMAKAITPFDYLYSTNLIEGSKSLFISASGRNNDILISAKKAIAHHSHSLANLSMRVNNPLGKEVESYQCGISSNYELPVGKDGFLATNSLVAFFGILHRAFCTDSEMTCIESILESSFASDYLTFFSKEVENRMNFTVLYGGWGQPVACDIESKFTEAALGAVQLADYRNFGHGRHHWFDKHRESSSIVAIVTPKEKLIAEKTLSLIPDDIPRVILESEYDDSMASIDLLVKSFYLVEQIGKIRKIDPGRPGVPEFGRKLYHLRYASLYNDAKMSGKNEDLFIARKAHVDSISQISKNEKELWMRAYTEFLRELLNSKFSGLILDYDGTLCSQDDRYSECLDEGIARFIETLLKNKIKIGVATGRGKSIRTLLRNSIDRKYWSNIYVGYYNGAESGSLSDELIPNSETLGDYVLTDLYDSFFSDYIVTDDDFHEVTLKSFQLTIRAKNKRIFDFVKSAFQSLIVRKRLSSKVCVLESSHSLDIILRPRVSKLNIVDNHFKDDTVLCIGDKGLLPGNDFELLSIPCSLSVDEVSYDPASCWNLAPRGVKNINATYDYMSKFVVEEGYFKINVGL